MRAVISFRNWSTVKAATVLMGWGSLAFAQPVAPPRDLSRVNQDEIASFYGRMNVVVGSGARAFGMGGAFLARADDATAASWNPAGLSYLRRTEFSLVGVHNDFSQKTALSSTGGAAHPGFREDRLTATVADFAGFALPLRVKDRLGAIQVSYQRSFSFSGSRRSEAQGQVLGFLPDGKPAPLTEFTVEGKGGFDTVSLSSGFEVAPGLRLGVSVNRWINGFRQTVNRNDIGTQNYRLIESHWKLHGTNFNVGALITPIPRLNLGGVFKSGFTAGGNLSKKRTDFDLNEAPKGQRHSGNISVRFPRVFGFGASYQASNTVTLSADFTRTEWSKARITDFFALGRSSTDSANVDPFAELPFPAVEEALVGQFDTSQFRVGGEWVLRPGSSGRVLVPVRMGFFHDGQPVTVPSIKSVKEAIPVEKAFSGFTLGAGITLGGVLFDVAYIREGGTVQTALYKSVKPNPNEDTTVIEFDQIGPDRRVRYGRFFASVMVRFGPRR
jgi:hypothetical protein